MKKSLAILLTLVLMVSVLPMGLFTVTASAATSGTTGDCTWTLDGTVLTISGNGEMGGYYSSHAQWDKSITKLIIENGVINVGDYAFSWCTRLTSITIPDSVTSIGWGSFRGCDSLKTVYYSGTGVQWETVVIDNSYNYNYPLLNANIICNADLLTYEISNGEVTITDCDTSIVGPLTIPETFEGYTVTSIGDGAFNDCTLLTAVTIPDSVKYIGKSAFRDCTSLTSITIPDSVTSIFGCSFYGTGYYNNSENWEGNLLYIDHHLVNAWAQYDTKSYTIKEGTLTIAGSLFYNDLICVPDEEFDDDYFTQCVPPYILSVVMVTIPRTVKHIGDNVFNEWVFSEWSALEVIYYSGTEAEWSQIDFGNNSDALSNVQIKCAAGMVSQGSIRYEGVDKNGKYQAAGVRYKGCLSKEMHEGATEIGFIAAPTHFLEGMTLSEYFNTAGNQCISAKVKANGMKDKIYASNTDENDRTYYDYQLIISGLTREGVTQNMLDTEISVCMYVVIDGETIYTETMAYSYNYIAALMK